MTIAAANSNVSVSIKSRPDGQVMDAHREWARRPADEAVYSFQDLLDRAQAARVRGIEHAGVPWRDLFVTADTNSKALWLRSGGKAGGTLGAWSADQLARIVGAPAEYVKSLPAHLAADCFNHGLRTRTAHKREAQILTHGTSVRSIMSDAYTRIWDVEIAQLAAGLADRGTWGAFEAFRRAGAGAGVAGYHAAPLPLGWVGDRSTFVALADYESPIEVNGSLLARFALLSNSEVGAGSFKITIGLVDYACCNFILWGCQQVREIRIRHVGDVRERFAEAAGPMTAALTSGERTEIRDALVRSTRVLVADTRDEVVAKGAVVTELPKAHIEAAYELAEQTPRYGDPRSVWGLLSGLTEASQKLHKNADKRAKADAGAARLMGLLRG